MAMRNQRQTKQEKPKAKKVDVLRRAEYYDMQEVFDRLYLESAEGKPFTQLMDLILDRENILLAYRNIKRNSGSVTPGTDGLTIENLAKVTPDCMVQKVRNILRNYRPRTVRRKDIPKEGNPEKTRPLGIPCMWDRLIQQCVLQILDPICEAKFSDNSYGFRPNRSCEHAVAQAYRLIQQSGLRFVVEVDVKGFFDNVNHSKLIKQMWAMGIQDKTLIYIIRQMLKAPIAMPDGSVIIPDKGTPQGGLCSPVLANIVLNELDRWIESQWQENPVVYKHSTDRNANGSLIKSHGYAAMRKTRLKEMYIVRYADDFRIFCRTRGDAVRTMAAVTKWLEERLKLQVSPEKTRVVNLKRQYSEFLGFKIKVREKKHKQVVKSHICDKAAKKIAQKSVAAIKEVARPTGLTTEYDAIRKYNSMVMGWHNYYRIATNVSLDFDKINFRIQKVWKNRLKERLKKPDNNVNGKSEVVKRYGESAQLRFVSGQPVAPLGYIKTKHPMHRKREVNKYTSEGRTQIHDNLGINTGLMLALMRQQSFGRSAEFMDNRISLFCAQYGKCAVTGYEFNSVDEVYCHHLLPREAGGRDNYGNLMIVREEIHILIHAKKQETIDKYLAILRLNKKQLTKLDRIREKVGRQPIDSHCRQ
jgi:group II intron reverse transcriptase/maturase